MIRCSGGWAILLFALACLLATAGARAETSIASWYGTESGSRTANGEHFDGSGMTCAHRRYAFGTRLRVTDLASGRSIVCRVNDRGPYIRGRSVDLSRAAAGRLGIIGRGTARVRIEVMGGAN